jgi:Protein of unknown function (DUF3107)
MSPRLVRTGWWERITVEVKIGIQSVLRELVVETTSSAEDIESSLAAAVTGGGMFVLPDEKGGKVLVPAEKIGYVEFTGAEQRRIGFRNT